MSQNNQDNQQPKRESSEQTSFASSACYVPWVGKLIHNKDPYADWGMIRDESGKNIIHILLPTWDEKTLNKHRRDKTDPTQKIIDYILPIINSHNAQDKQPTNNL